MKGQYIAYAKGVKIRRLHNTKEDIPQLFFRHYPTYKAGNLNVSELARICDMSRNTLCKYIHLLEE